MGLTKSSTGTNLLTEDFESLKIENGYTIALAGNPNVGKSTIFNSLTGMHQHTGNWPGKTIANATGKCVYNDTGFLFVDIPGTYSILSNSEEEEIARNYICNGLCDCSCGCYMLGKKFEFGVSNNADCNKGNSVRKFIG